MSIKKHIPNLLTLGNLLCGVLAILYITNYNFEMAAILIGVGLIFDFFDGTVARLLKVSSNLGKDLDSLADVVSFGVAPGLVLFAYYGLATNSGTLMETFGLNALALTIPLFAAYRLAVFNNTPQSTEYFSGLPTPAFAAVCFAYTLIPYESPFFELIISPWFFSAFVLLGGVLMLGRVKLISFKLGSKNALMNRLRIVLIIVFMICIGFFKFFGAILCLLMYLVISLSLQKRLQEL